MTTDEVAGAGKAAIGRQPSFVAPGGFVSGIPASVFWLLILSSGVWSYERQVDDAGVIAEVLFVIALDHVAPRHVEPAPTVQSTVPAARTSCPFSHSYRLETPFRHAISMISSLSVIGNAFASPRCQN